ncbi:hypothetical protein BJA01nite_24700 [Bradyrhizobium japonicum]|nr:hypothetical protein BJ6T_61190 [Bradyrhizobium japonicum USDA 6]GEC44828.1 hypothetical protein BJA01nite_24700 [Bradyrhizobium japonicum]
MGLNSPTSETCDTGNPRIAQETPTNVETNAMQVKRTNRLMMRLKIRAQPNRVGVKRRINAQVPAMQGK